MSNAALTILPPENEAPAAGYAVSPITPMAMLSQAVERGANPETLEKLLALQERWEAGRARKAFDEALAAAKSEIPVIRKNRTVGFDNKDGSKTSYQHEDLGEIARTVDPILARHGLSYRFRTTSEINQPISVTCIVSHRDGHSEENTLTGPRDDSGKKNLIQQMGSSITYLQRYTLKAALGLAAAADDDGRSAGEEGAASINPEQVETLVELIDSVRADRARFLRHFQIEALADLPTARFDEAVRMLNAKSGAR